MERWKFLQFAITMLLIVVKCWVEREMGKWQDFNFSASSVVDVFFQFSSKSNWKLCERDGDGIQLRKMYTQKRQSCRIVIGKEKKK